MGIVELWVEVAVVVRAVECVGPGLGSRETVCDVDAVGCMVVAVELCVEVSDVV